MTSLVGTISEPQWMTDEHRMYGESTRAFLQSELVPHIERWRSEGLVERSFWNKAGEAGLLGATIPEAFGGTGAPYSFDAITTYELSYAGDSGWGFAIQSIVAHYIMSYGTPQQKDRWLPRLATGELVASIAMTEPGTGSDLQAVRTTAEPVGDEYVINGSKTFITNGQTGDLVCVVARTNKDAPGAKGISLVMLETDGADGFKRGRNLTKLGMKSADTSELFFEDVRVRSPTCSAKVKAKASSS